MPSRRQVLAALPPLLAGCTSSPPARRPTTTATPTPPEMIEDCQAMPTPPASPTRAETREFVAAYEEAFVYNWLVAQNGGPNECRPDGPGSSVSSADVGGATEIDIEPVQTAVVTETEGGYYVVSSCSGRAEYWCYDEGSACSGAGRNAHFVTHFVGDERHVRVPHNWLVCHPRDEPYRSPDSDENIPIPSDESGMTFRVYPFREAVSADVTLTYLDTNERVLKGRYSPNVGPAVQSNVTVATGDYELVAETNDERTVLEFSLSGRDDTAWNGVSVYIGLGGLHVVEVATDGDLTVPESTCYKHRTTDAENDENGMRWG